MVEIIVIIIVIGLLMAIAIPNFQRQVEKSRYSEAYTILGSIFDDAQVYLVERGNLGGFDIDPDLKAPNSSHYFYYSVDGNIATAKRCTGTQAGKQPNATGNPEPITIDLLSGATSASWAAGPPAPVGAPAQPQGGGPQGGGAANFQDTGNTTQDAEAYTIYTDDAGDEYVDVNRDGQHDEGDPLLVDYGQ